MKLKIDGKHISMTKVEILCDDIAHTAVIHFDDVTIELGEMTKDGVLCKFHQLTDDTWLVRENETDTATEDMADKEAWNENFVADELQYSYATFIKGPSDLGTITLHPERVRGLSSMIVFAPQEEVDVTYKRKEEGQQIKEIIKTQYKRLWRFMLVAYPVCLGLAALCVYLPNVIDSYTLSRFLGGMFVFFAVGPLIGMVVASKEYIKLWRYLLSNSKLPSNWKEGEKAEMMVK